MKIIIPFILVFFLAASFLGMHQQAQASSVNATPIRFLNSAPSKVDSELLSKVPSLQPDDMQQELIPAM